MESLNNRKETTKRLINLLSELNPKATFRSGIKDIYTDLIDEDLKSIKIPKESWFLEDTNETYCYGFVKIIFESDSYLIVNENYD